MTIKHNWRELQMEMKLNYKRTFFIGLAFLSISAFWQMYDNVIPLILQNTFHLGETVTGVVMAMDNVLALFLLPVFGTLSDKVDTKWGKRTPFIVGGTLLAVTFMMLLPLADKTNNLLLFVLADFATLMSMGLYRSPAVALMPDVTPTHLRSRANAVINLMGAVGGVYTLIMITLLVGEGKTPDYLPLFISVVSLMLVAIIVLVTTIKEKKLKEELADTLAEADAAQAAVDGRNVDSAQKTGEENDASCAHSAPKKKLPKEVKRSMIFILISIFLWFTAYNAVTTAFSRYTMEVWGMENGSYANCLMVATVAAIISYIPIGQLSSKIGRKKTIMSGILLMASCYGFAMFVNEYHPIINIAFGLIGVAWAAIGVNSYPMIVAMSEGCDIGKFTGTYYTFSMSAQILTPILSGFLLENVSYRTLFPYALVFSLLAFLTMSQVKHGDAKPQQKASVLENFDVDD